MCYWLNEFREFLLGAVLIPRYLILNPTLPLHIDEVSVWQAWVRQVTTQKNSPITLTVDYSETLLAVSASDFMGLIEIGAWLRGVRESFPFGFMLLHVGGFAFFFVYPPLYDLICPLCKRERRTALVPWEDVVAVCGCNPCLGPGGITGFLGWNFVLLPPAPERPGYTLPGAGIIASVGGLPGALTQ